MKTYGPIDSEMIAGIAERKSNEDELQEVADRGRCLVMARRCLEKMNHAGIIELAPGTECGIEITEKGRLWADELLSSSYPKERPTWAFVWSVKQCGMDPDDYEIAREVYEEIRLEQN